MGHSPFEAVVAESHALTRAGLVHALEMEKSIEGVAEATSLADIFDVLPSATDAKLLIADVNLNGVTRDFAAFKKLRHTHPDLRIIVAADNCDRALILDALAAGVHGCLPKSLSMEEISLAIRLVLSGQVYVPNSVVEMAPPKDPDPITVVPIRSNSVDMLTARQREVLHFLTQGKSNKEIGRALHISESTVKVHVTAAFRQMGVKNRIAAVAALQSRSAPAEHMVPLLSSMRNFGRRAGDMANNAKQVA